MNNYSSGAGDQLAEFETPFADNTITKEQDSQNESPTYSSQFFAEFESPFSQTFEIPQSGQTTSPLAGEFVQFLGELEDTEFPNTLYEMAAELEDTWSSKISNEAAMGDRFIPFATQQANEYFSGIANETERMIDLVSKRYTGNNLGDHSEAEVERFFTEFEFEHSFSPAQEQFFGSIFNKVKSVVKAGVNLAKKGISFVGKLLPINIILDKLKALIRPLLNKVLKFAIGKLPQNLQPYAQTFANKFLGLPAATQQQSEDNEIPTTASLEAVQTEFDSHIANLVFAPDNEQAEETTMSYETSTENLQRENNYETGGLNVPSLDVARQQFINELKDLKEGESPAPAIEKFLPAAIMALQPVIKMALGIIGRQKVINFLAGILAKLVGRYVPENVAQPLAASIIDTGMSAIGFETYEMNKPDVAYEAIANTIQETIQNMGQLNEDTLNNNEALTSEMLEAFESAAANNFPAQYIREELRHTTQPGMWVLGPRNGPRHFYKKFTHVFNVNITPHISRKLTTFRGLPLANFLRDKLGLDPNKTIQARVHLYQAIPGTRLSQINRFERVPGLGASQPHGNVQFHPLTVEAATLLCKEPGLGKNFPSLYTARRHRTAVGQRFFYLEINGARLRIAVTENRSHQHTGAPVSPQATPAQDANNSNTAAHPPVARAANSTDIQGVINFVRSEIRFNYYFSEEEAKSVVEKLNSNDFIDAAASIKHSVHDVLNEVLIQNVGNKVRIVHESMPEMYLENYVEQENPVEALGKTVQGGVSLNAGKHLLTSLIKQFIERLSESSRHAITHYFKTQAVEFKKAQAEPQDGVTIKITWSNVQGMSAFKTLINAIKGNLSVGNLGNLSLPHIHKPEVKISAGKRFD